MDLFCLCGQNSATDCGTTLPPDLHNVSNAPEETKDPSASIHLHLLMAPNVLTIVGFLFVSVRIKESVSCLLLPLQSVLTVKEGTSHSL